ncbi:MAG: OsmC family protein [Christensenellales bacterium]
MTIIRYKDGQNEIYNEAGRQALGSLTAGMEGLNPRELLEASLGLCVSITLTALFKRDGISLGPEGFDVHVAASKAEGIKNRLTDFKVSVKFPDLEPEYKRKAMIIAERGCTIGNTLVSGANVVLKESEE